MIEVLSTNDQSHWKDIIISLYKDVLLANDCPDLDLDIETRNRNSVFAVRERG